MSELGTILQADLIRRAGPLWEQATSAPFLDAVASGEISQEAFGRWLTQDYLFARGLLAFQAVTLAKAPRDAHKLLIGGLAALGAELDWFENHAQRLGLDLAVEPHPICRRYTDYLIRSAYEEPASILFAVLFGIEVTYLAAWSALKPEGPYAEFIRRWSSAEFAKYVQSLREITERHAGPLQQEHFNYVLELEQDFWKMSWEG